MRQSSNQTTILLDGNNAMWRSFHIFSGEIGASYGFLRQLRYFLHELEADECIICWDGRKASHSRKAIYPEYKAGRDKNNADYQLFYNQYPFLRLLLKLTGVTQTEDENLEADDAIASIIHFTINERRAGRQYVIISADKDLLPLVQPGVLIYQPVKERLIGPSNFQEEIGLTPTQYFEMRLLSGDSSDNIKGVTGEKGAMWIIQKFGTIENFFRVMTLFQEDSDCSLPGIKLRSEASEIRQKLKWKKFRELLGPEAIAKLELSVSLMSPRIEEVKLEKGKLSETHLQRLFFQAGFNSLLTEFMKWIQPFREL